MKVFSFFVLDGFSGVDRNGGGKYHRSFSLRISTIIRRTYGNGNKCNRNPTFLKPRLGTCVRAGKLSSSSEHPTSDINRLPSRTGTLINILIDITTYTDPREPSRLTLRLLAEWKGSLRWVLFNLVRRR